MSQADNFHKITCFAKILSQMSFQRGVTVYSYYETISTPAVPQPVLSAEGGAAGGTAEGLFAGVGAAVYL